MLKLAYKVGSRGGAMVSTSARNAGDPWFESRSCYDRFCKSIFICLYIYILSLRRPIKGVVSLLWILIFIKGKF